MTITRPSGGASAQARFDRMQQSREDDVPPVFISGLTERENAISDSIPEAIRTLTGNAYIFESEMETLAPIINRLIASGDVREFVREIAKSDTFRSRFFSRSSPMRFVEVVFKLILARAPSSHSEVSEFVKLLAEKGYDAVIDKLVDSEEYTRRFGSALVPKMTATGVYLGGMPAFTSQMKLQLHTRGGNTDVTSTTPSTIFPLVRGRPATHSEIMTAYRVTFPNYYRSSSYWNILPKSRLVRDWTSVSLIPGNAAVNLGLKGIPRVTTDEKEEWSEGWSPSGKLEGWSPGWSPFAAKSYV